MPVELIPQWISCVIFLWDAKKEQFFTRLMSLKGDAMTSLNTKNPVIQNLNKANETSWLQLGILWEGLQDVDKAHFCFENTLRHNPFNIKALTQAATICRLKEYYPKVRYRLNASFFLTIFLGSRVLSKNLEY